MPKRGLEAAPGQHAVRSDNGRSERTAAARPPVHGSSAFVESHACATNLGVSDVSRRDNARPDNRPGWAMAFALGPLGLRDTPVEYLEALRRLRAMRQVNAKYVRPTLKSAGGTSNATAYGIFSKVPPEERVTGHCT